MPCRFCGSEAEHTLEGGWRCKQQCERTPTLWHSDDKRPIFYLAGAMTEACEKDHGLRWRYEVATKWAWAARFHIPYTPNSAPHVVVRHDLAAIRQADVFLWRFDPKEPTIGTCMEAFYARRETVAKLVLAHSKPSTFEAASPWLRWFLNDGVGRTGFLTSSIDEGVAWALTELGRA